MAPGGYQFGPFQFDARKCLLYRGADPLPLTPKVAETLHHLLLRHGTLIEKSGVFDRKHFVKAVLGFADLRDGHLDADLAEPWSADQHQKRGDGFALCRKILEALPDERIFRKRV